ncbi:MAG: hypothetical protein ACK5GV_08620 [Bacteroidota bacterium]|jgi:hypothetical protein
MIEKIYIPTVNRVNNQITYNSLPDELKKKVVLVVQEWERPQYSYDCEYLVVPNTKEKKFKYLAKTREFIYKSAGKIKYAMIDDDIVIARRNSKYFSAYGHISNMEKSKRVLIENDFFDMFSIFDRWLDEVSLCSCAMSNFPPGKRLYKESSAVSFGIFFINGNDIYPFLEQMKLGETSIAEDVVFTLYVLGFGLRNRVTEEFVLDRNISVEKKISSFCWDDQSMQQSLKDFKYIETLFPGVFNIKYNSDGTPVQGYRNSPNCKIDWKRARGSKLSFANFNAL